MIVGILKKIKTAEHRVCMTPAGMEVLQQNGHQMLVEHDAEQKLTEALVKAKAVQIANLG